jgi:DNA-binding NarL/FixJ family response regulator
MGDRAAGVRSLSLGLVWVDSSYSVVSLGLEKALAGKARVHRGPKAPERGRPSLVIVCPEGDEDDVTSEVERVKETTPGGAVVVFGSSPDLKLARAVLRAGGRGYLHAGMPPEQLARAAEVAVAGETVVPRGMLRELVEEGGDRASLADISPRQEEILRLVAEGLSNAEIARRLYLSESTIKQHLRKAYKTLGVESRIEAVSVLGKAFNL